MNLKTTISTTRDIYDENSLWLPKGNYYFTIREISNCRIKGDLIDRGLRVNYSFNYITFIRMMSNAQARLARRANITSPNMPDILSPVTSPHRSTPNLLTCNNNRILYTSNNAQHTTSLPTLPTITQTNTSSSTTTNSSTEEHTHTLEKCAICLDVINARRSLRSITTLRCNHTFHKNCIDRWARLRNTCPVCRRRVRQNRSSSRTNIRSNNGSTRSSRYVIRNTNTRSSNNSLANLPSIEERYASRRTRYYRNISNR